MRYLTVEEVIHLQQSVVARSGGLPGIKNRGLIESSAAQPRMTFDGTELYPTIGEKAAALAFSLASNHCFEDGNKRIAHAAMETFLVLNGHELEAPVEEQEAVFLKLAAAQFSRDEFTSWVTAHIKPSHVGKGSAHGS
jgi:death-on-curing protein